MNESIGWEEVIDNIHYPWDWSALSSRLPLTKKIIAKFAEKLSFRHISENPHVTIDIILSFPQKNWDWLRLSSVLPMSVIQEHPHQDLANGFWKWNWYHVSRNHNVSWEFVERHPSAPWSFFALSQNPQDITRRQYLKRRELAFIAGKDTKCPNHKISMHDELLSLFWPSVSLTTGDHTSAATVLQKIRGKTMHPHALSLFSS